ncbi:hypothetical protein D3C84_1250310 [compost metagenome]
MAFIQFGAPTLERHVVIPWHFLHRSSILEMDANETLGAIGRQHAYEGVDGGGGLQGGR